MAKKLAEEAIEVGLDAVQMNRESVILESADVLYHLAVIWAECGISPADVMSEIDRRERVYGIAEKLPKQASRGANAAHDPLGDAPQERSPERLSRAGRRVAWAGLTRALRHRTTGSWPPSTDEGHPGDIAGLRRSKE